MVHRFFWFLSGLVLAGQLLLDGLFGRPPPPLTIVAAVLWVVSLFAAVAADRYERLERLREKLEDEPDEENPYRSK